jgi:tetratricopeptide (TPR) repeat protein
MTATIEFEHLEEGNTLASELYDESVRCFRKAISLNADDIEATEGIIFSYLNANPKSPKYKEAIFAAQEIYTRLTSNHRVEVMLGNVLSISRTSKTRDKARTLYKNALKRCRQQGSNPLKALLGLVKLYSTDKDYSSAIEILRYHIDRGMKETESVSRHDISCMWSKLGEVYATSGNTSEALEAYHTALSLVPEGDCPSALSGLEELADTPVTRDGMDISADTSFTNNTLAYPF